MTNRAPQCTAGHPRHRGFTLIEILIVIGVIVLLVSIVAVSIRPVRNNIAARSTRAAIDNVLGMQQEYENAMALHAFMKENVVLAYPPPPPAEPLQPYDATSRLMSLAYRMPKNKDAMEKMAGSGLADVTREWKTTHPYLAGEIVVHNSIYFRAKQNHVGETPVGDPTDAYWSRADHGVVVPVDGWGKALMYVGSGLEGIKVDPAGIRGYYGVLALAGNLDYSGFNHIANSLQSASKRPFWVSAGPDGDFVTHDDNIYSFSN